MLQPRKSEGIIVFPRGVPGLGERGVTGPTQQVRQEPNEYKGTSVCAGYMCANIGVCVCVLG